ncbi:response regulator transcription factor [Agromyces bauzanensis]|uniref:response regulator transcription factor n=1 Tax=Agromyces bauzanensis TaxID=1308924 RepID=UPI0035717638
MTRPRVALTALPQWGAKTRSRSAERQVVVSHKPLIRAAMSYVLVAQAGCSVTEAGDGAQALAIVDRINPALVVLDLEVPYRRGIAALATLLVASGSMPKIVGYGSYSGVHQRPWMHVPAEAPLGEIISVLGSALGGKGESNGRHDSPRLTRRQLEVLALVAAGHSNRQIGEVLFLSTWRVA